jgi:hypothetical protein
MYKAAATASDEREDNRYALRFPFSTLSQLTMVGPQYDLLANPLGAVRSTFDTAISSGSDPTSLNGRDWGAVDLFRHLLSDQSQLSQVTFILNFHTLLFQSNQTLILKPCVSLGSASYPIHYQIHQAQYSCSLSWYDSGHARK